MPHQNSPLFTRLNILQGAEKERKLEEIASQIASLTKKKQINNPSEEYAKSIIASNFIKPFVDFNIFIYRLYFLEKLNIYCLSLADDLNRLFSKADGQINQQELCQLLALPSDSRLEVIDSALKKLLLFYHPDKNLGATCEKQYLYEIVSNNLNSIRKAIREKPCLLIKLNYQDYFTTAYSASLMALITLPVSILALLYFSFSLIFLSIQYLFQSLKSIILHTSCSSPVTAQAIYTYALAIPITGILFLLGERHLLSIALYGFIKGCEGGIRAFLQAEPGNKQPTPSDTVNTSILAIMYPCTRLVAPVKASSNTISGSSTQTSNIPSNTSYFSFLSPNKSFPHTRKEHPTPKVVELAM
jgi:hypothetical protein